MKSNACLSLAGETLILITDISLFLRYTLFLFLCSQLFSSELNAQYDFERISNELGLSQNYVTAVCQDEQGFLWVGTRNGLNRYDGYAFRTFTSIPGDSLSLSGNIIECLYTDSQGRLWIGTTKGLNRFDPTTESFIRYPLLPPIVGGAAGARLIFEKHYWGNRCFFYLKLHLRPRQKNAPVTTTSPSVRLPLKIAHSKTSTVR